MWDFETKHVLENIVSCLILKIFCFSNSVLVAYLLLKIISASRNKELKFSMNSLNLFGCRLQCQVARRSMLWLHNLTYPALSFAPGSAIGDGACDTCATRGRGTKVLAKSIYPPRRAGPIPKIYQTIPCLLTMQHFFASAFENPS